MTTLAAFRIRIKRMEQQIELLKKELEKALVTIKKKKE